MTGEAPRRGGPTVLVVDDEADVREAMRRIIARRGYTVIGAASGREALSLVRAADRPIELLLTDICMPGEVSAAELAARVTELHPDVRVLFVSGYPKEILVDKGMISAEVDIVEKPFTPRRLAEAVSAALAAPVE
jgi:DNA-binding NtrC family response regulator